MNNYSIEKQINNTSMRKPHLVILGAGASKATLPNGDKNKTPLPLMNDLIDLLDLHSLIEDYSISNSSKKFEEFYSSISDMYPELSRKIENKIYDYFSSLEIPNEPTLYDHLILSLRKKDVIATFNWDPLLYQAMERNVIFLRKTFGRVPYPRILYLHGNVAVGYCIHKCSSGKVGQNCSKCNTPYIKSQLLYPVSKKNYSSNLFIQNQWKNVQYALKNAHCVTVFGYSKPTSDVMAIDLFKQGWGKPEDRQFEEFEIINTKDTVDEWEKDFIYTHHYKYTSNFFNSIIARSPRRSCEVLRVTHMENFFLEGNIQIKKYNSFKDLYRFVTPLIDAELANKKKP